MADTVLESFLIKLGFQVDQASSKTFTTTVAEAGKQVLKFTTAIAGMATAVEEAVRRAAFQLDRLHTTATLAGESSQELQEYAQAVNAIGGNYEAAIQAQVKFATELREAPWMKDYAKDLLGRDFKSVSDFFEGITHKYADLIKMYGETGEQTVTFGQQLRENLHIDTTNLFLAAKAINKFDEDIRHTREEAELFRDRFQKAQDASRELAFNFKELSNTIKGYYQTAFGGLEHWLAGIYADADKWLKDQIPAFNAWMDELEGNFTKHDWAKLGEQLGKAIGEGIKYVIDHMPEWAEAGTGAAEKFINAFGDALLKQMPAGLSNFLTTLQRGFNAASGIANPGEDKPESFWHWLTTDIEKQPGYRKPNMQHGGIVPINAHAGEMVLPANISEGLQSFFMGADNPLDFLGDWLTGDTSYTPQIYLAAEVYDKLGDVIEDVLSRVGFGGGGGAGGGGGGGAGGGYGGGGMGDVGSIGGGGVSAAAIKGTTLVPQMVALAKARGASPAVIQALVATALGEGGVTETWKPGDKGTSFGPWQLHKGGELDPFLAQGGKAGDLESQLDYVLRTIEKRHPGFLKMTDARAAIAQFRHTFRDYGANEANLAPAGELISRGGTTEMEPTTVGGPASSEKMGRVVDTMLSMKGMSIYSPQLREFMKAGGVNLDPRYAAWCAAFVSSSLQHFGVKGAGNIANSFQTWGSQVSLQQMMKGDVGIATHGLGPGQTGGHAVMMTGRKMMEQGRWMVETIGREGDRVFTRWRAASDLMFRRAPGVDNSQTTYNINGVTDPHGVARATADMNDHRSANRRRQGVRVA